MPCGFDFAEFGGRNVCGQGTGMGWRWRLLSYLKIADHSYKLQDPERGFTVYEEPTGSCRIIIQCWRSIDARKLNTTVSNGRRFAKLDLRRCVSKSGEDQSIYRLPFDIYMSVRSLCLFRENWYLVAICVARSDRTIHYPARPPWERRLVIRGDGHVALRSSEIRSIFDNR